LILIYPSGERYPAWESGRKRTEVAKYRSALPQLGGDFFMTDGGLETTLIFLEGQDLPEFAAFLLYKTPEGEGVLRKYFLTYAEYCARKLVECWTDRLA
jgi:S-methylmethionine-dependent homocysteine/selenocysteine methylase